MRLFTFLYTFILKVWACLSRDCAVSMDLVIAVDASLSVGYQNFLSSLDFVEDIINELDIDNGKAKVGMLTFDHYSEIIFHLNTYSRKSDIKMAVRSAIYTEGGTRIKVALKKVVNTMFTELKGDRSDIKDIIILLTDGESYDDPIPIANSIRQQGITLYVFGIGRYVSRTQLEGIASTPINDHLFIVESFSDLAGFGKNISVTICQAQAPKELPCSAAKEETFRLKRGYMLPMMQNSLSVDVPFLADCISVCIHNSIYKTKCQTFNFCKPDDGIRVNCELSYSADNWESKLITNSSCIFGFL